MVIKKNISITLEIYKIIDQYAKEHKCNFSKACSDLIQSTEENANKNIILINDEINNISKKVNISYSLLKQLYSDIQIENITDTKQSKSLKEFYKRNNKIND